LLVDAFSCRKLPVERNPRYECVHVYVRAKKKRGTPREHYGE
jgi:hypothetical protein